MKFERLIHLICVLALVIVPTAGADERQSEVDSYQFIIERNTYIHLDNVLSPAKFAEQSESFSLPILPPANSLDVVRRMAEEELIQVIEEEYPRERHQQIVDEAQESFRLYREGERVSIRARKYGTEPQVFEGILHRSTSTHVRVGDITLSMQDIVPEDQARLVREMQDQYITRYIRVHKQRFDRDRQQFAEAQRPIVISTIYRQNGYLPYQGRWVPARTLFLRVYENHRAELYKQYRAKVEAEVLQAQGWAFDEAKTLWTHPKYKQVDGVLIASIPEAPNPFDEARPVLADIVKNLYGDTGGSGPGTGPGTNLFDAPLEDVPPAPPANDVGDLYDED